MKKLRFISGIVLSCSVLVLAACGQKGPLYLPVKPVPAATTASPTQAPAPAERKKASE